MNIPTMAVKITDKTYPVAIACLPPAFALYPKEDVLGAYIVINDLFAERAKGDVRDKLVIGNSWMTEDVFNERYKFVTQEAKFTFSEVKKISQSKVV